jgi:hypothetical protein
MSLRKKTAAARTVGAGTRTVMRRLSRDRMTRSLRAGAKTPGAQIATMSRSARIVGLLASKRQILAAGPQGGFLPSPFQHAVQPFREGDLGA